ncbi:MAG: phosphoglucosamine mutase [Bacillota bacterium]|nr:phosphoglucosamine mutase [Bacillota bacterium]
MARLFGTDGVRGIANKELTCELAYKLGQAAAVVLTEDTKHKPKIMIGKDTRISSDMLEAAMTAGICSVGGDVISCGVIPTPAVAYLTRKYGADAGVVISASHNSFEHNGIKIFNGQGFKLRDELEDEIEEIVKGESDKEKMASSEEIGRIIKPERAIDDYVRFLFDNTDTTFEDFRVVFDCANGATSAIIPRFIHMFGVNATVINAEPNGININEKCGSTHIEELSKTVTRLHAKVGIAFDGDGDRMLAVDENGILIDGDKLIAIFATKLKQENMLKNNTAVVTTMSNLGFFECMSNHEINTSMTKVGDKYVLEEMLKNGYSIGGEQSGHIIFGDIATTGDGMLSAVKLLQILYKDKVKASALGGIMEKYPQVLINVNVTRSYKEAHTDDEELLNLIDKYNAELEGKGRLIVRASGTEPLIRVMVEGKDFDEINEIAKDIAGVITKANQKINCN